MSKLVDKEDIIMSEFNFNSQVCTFRSQSERLLALGLKKETADMCWMYGEVLSVNPPDLTVDIPAWSLHRLLSMLPDDAPKIFWILDGASITIDVENDCNTFFPHKGNIYNSVVDCIEWLIEEGYFPKEYLV